MAKNELNVHVDINVGIPVAQAQRALKIVEWFLNDNINVGVVSSNTDGTIKLNFANKCEKPDCF